MTTNFKTHQPRSAMQASVISIQGEVLRRFGSMRAITMEKKTVNANQIFGAQKNASELIDGAFGKIFCDAQLKKVVG